jgi:para-aminobenzoate synthetase component 1
LRTFHQQSISNISDFKNQLLHWSQQFREVVFMDSNSSYNRNQKYKEFDFILAVDAFTSIKTDYSNAFADLHQYQSITKDWLFGYLSYDLKNNIEHLHSNNYDGLHFPDLFFFQPKKLFLVKGNQLEIQYLSGCDDEVDSDLEEILASCQKEHNLNTFASNSPNTVSIKQRVSKEEYLSKVTKMLTHISRGDIYEANFCIEFYAENATINPETVYKKLNLISEPPFAVFFKNNDHFLISASPERYIKKDGLKVISQPIKGTARRLFDVEQDEISRSELENDPKERSENIMIVDLVRNDLSKTATKASVNVEELCGIYSFKQVHQMISTVVSEIENTTAAVEVLQTTFPMGSMTGAPKISAMNIIENLEETKRGLYSGAAGYFTPDGNFDFNVVIRSILYNCDNHYLSFSVGSAITAKSNPESEYEECLLKAKAMFEVLQ